MSTKRESCFGRASVPASLLLRLAWLAGTLAFPIALSAATDYSEVDSIFTQHCFDCHEAKEPEAKLVLESYETLLKGGESGAVIVPAKSAESLLVKMVDGGIERDGKKVIMPPGKRKKLTSEEI